MKKYGMLIVVLALVQSVFGQERGERIMEQVEAQKVAYFTQVLDLTPEESQFFWPFYNRYQDKMRELKKQNTGNLRNRDLTDAEAETVIADFFTMKEKELAYQKQLYTDLKGVLPPTKLVKLQFAEQQFKQKLLERIKKRRENLR
jgi:hypothetical protein